MKPVRDKLIQSRLDEDELADFDEVKKMLGEENNSKAVRRMIKDEMMLKKAKEEWKKGNTDMVTELVTKLSDEGRLPLVEALMGITDTKTSSQLSILQNQFSDIQSQLEAIMMSVTQMGNNLNQIAKVMNTAAKEDEDLTDTELWKWISLRLFEDSRYLSVLKKKIADLKVDVGLKEKDESTHVYPANTQLPF
ncbi:plasmid mobilization relaxosome protein MobC [Limosilactobacillus mucosae]|uniref:plasmid mobilization relaxosome protein MobC n=1 Tax=Limosilactobacillus mucosae TaxID=97478 RepID=UPI0025A44CBE|nr:plasmid mobilization relaxosome protein MobC [Limosilactobacillus mucosae]MDM8219256.1 plasmid mobilization relaxosome protein MobC [Limosilactobacillus mucosae]MDM8313912.1 plasmid mobilization relaxosome protein MobC [Limosilactobacillus mucosae]